MSEFKLNPKQQEAMHVLAGLATYIMLFGGSRSGKTFLLVRAVVMRALKAANSRHVVLRFRFNAVKASVVMDTFPKVMQLVFPGVAYRINKTDWFAEFDNGSQIWFAGLDDKERTEKILGMEFSTLYFNECSQIPWASVGIAITRLAQKAEQELVNRGKSELKMRAYFDCNPPSKAHWSYRVFIEKRDPETKVGHPRPDEYASFQINPKDNKENLSSTYLETLEGMSARLRRRFLEGSFADATPNALFPEDVIDRWRVTDGALPDMVRIVVGVDPSGSGDDDNADNDAIGIVVGGIGTDGNAYLLEDCTVKAGPATWGKVATSAYERHQADIVVGETNYGGAMVKHVIQTARPRTPYKQVTATRGKAVRAEPFSALYEQGKVRHAGMFPDLEDELVAFTTNGYSLGGSPNRADAWVWVLTELFPGLVKEKREPVKKTSNGVRVGGAGGWMGG